MRTVLGVAPKPGKGSPSTLLPGQFQGVYFDNVEPEFTTRIEDPE